MADPMQVQIDKLRRDLADLQVTAAKLKSDNVKLLYQYGEVKLAIGDLKTGLAKLEAAQAKPQFE